MNIKSKAEENPYKELDALIGKLRLDAHANNGKYAEVYHVSQLDHAVIFGQLVRKAADYGMVPFYEQDKPSFPSNASDPVSPPKEYKLCGVKIRALKPLVAPRVGSMWISKTASHAYEVLDIVTNDMEPHETGVVFALNNDTNCIHWITSLSRWHATYYEVIDVYS
jgi:hypothetical protein